MDESVLARFWAKVDQSGDCWEWLANRNNKGYGQFSSKTLRSTLAHRIAYELNVGPIPNGLVIDHICHNRGCVNPAHLRPVSPKQNNENRSGPQKNSQSGVRGVGWNCSDKKWVARVRHKGRNHFAGAFSSLADAEAAAIAKRLELFTHNDADRP